MRKLIALAALAVAAAAAPSSAHQTQGTDPADRVVKCGKTVHTIGQFPNAVYVDQRDVLGGQDPPVGHGGAYLWSVWVYAESNNHAGLQTKAGQPSSVVGPTLVTEDDERDGCTTSGHKGLKPDTLIL